MKLSEWIEKNSDLEIADIEALEKYLKKDSKTIWDIEIDNEYVYIRPTGKINYEKWDDEYFDKKARLAGNAFLTYEEAAREAKRREIEALLLKYGGRREFKDNQFNWCCGISAEGNDIIARPCMGIGYMHHDIFFDNEDALKNAVEAIGKQRLIDDYFKPYLEEDSSK